MSDIVVGERTLSLDRDGFLQAPTLWDEAVAKVLAGQEGVDTLSGKHWKVIDYVRGHYLEHGTAPMIRDLCKNTGFKLKEIYDLFPSGPAKGVCKIAGLPKPTGCV